MADVFISYFKPEHSLTKSLADDLEAAGVSVWWDTNLLGDDSFRHVIDAEIEACTRAIIIWTPQSITRPWVVAEADHANRLGKLINTVALGVDINRLPKPFGNINALALEDRQKIIATVQRAKDRGAMAAHTLSAARNKFPVGGAIFLWRPLSVLGRKHSATIGKATSKTTPSTSLRQRKKFKRR